MKKSYTFEAKKAAFSGKKRLNFAPKRSVRRLCPNGHNPRLRFFLAGKTIYVNEAGYGRKGLLDQGAK